METFKQYVMDICEDAGYTVEEDKGVYYITHRVSSMIFERLCDKFPGKYVYTNEYDAWGECLELALLRLVE